MERWTVDRRVSSWGLNFLNKIGHLVRVQGNGCWGGREFKEGQKPGITSKRYDEEGHRGSLESAVKDRGYTCPQELGHEANVGKGGGGFSKLGQAGLSIVGLVTTPAQCHHDAQRRQKYRSLDEIFPLEVVATN